MKLLWKRLWLENLPEKNRVIFFASADPAVESAEEGKAKHEKLLQALDKPVYFTTERLGELKKNPDLLKDPALRKKFSGVVRYYLSLLNPDKPSSPAYYTLFRIAGDPLLSKSLGDAERKKIYAFVNDRVSKSSLKDLKPLVESESEKPATEDADESKKESLESEDKNNFSKYWELFHLYVSLKDYKDLNTETKQYVERLRQNLGEIHAHFIHLCKRNNLGIGQLTPPRRIFLLQLNTLFQSELQTSENYRVQGSSDGIIEDIKGLTRQFVQDLQRKLEDKTALQGLLVDPEMMAYWEYILELDTQTLGITLTPEQRKKIENIIVRKKATEMVQSLDGLSMMLPQHYASLKALQKELVQSGPMEGLNLEVLDQKIENHKKAVEASESKVREHELKVFLDKVARMDHAYSVHMDDSKEAKEFKESLASFLKIQEKNAEGLKGSRVKKINRSDKSPEAGLQTLVDPNVIRVTKLSEDEQEDYLEAYRKLNHSLEAVWPSVGVDTTLHEKEFAKPFETLRGEELLVQKEQREVLEKLHDHKNVAADIASIEKPMGRFLTRYQKDLQKRFSEHKLEALDIEVLLDSEESIPGIPSEKIDVLAQTREKIVDILAEKAAEIYKEFDKDKALALINHKVLSVAGARASVIEKNQTILTEYSMLGSVQNQLIQAAFPKVQERVFALLGSSEIDRWAEVRVHHSPEKRADLSGRLDKDLESYKNQQQEFDGFYARSVHYLRAYCDKEGITPFPEGFAEKNIKALHKVYMEGGTFSTGKGLSHTFSGVNRLLTLGVNAKYLIAQQKEMHESFEKVLKPFTEEKQTLTKEDYEALQQQWKNTHYDSYIQELELEFSSVYSDNPDLLSYFKKGYFGQLRGYKKKLDDLFSAPLEAFSRTHLQHIRSTLESFRLDFDVREGSFKGEIKLASEAFSFTDSTNPNASLMQQMLGSVVGGFAVGSEYDVFQKNESGELNLDADKNVQIDEAKFKGKWSEERTKIGGLYEGYKERVQKMRSRIAEDMTKLSADDFNAKYGFDLTHGQELLEEYDGSLKKLQGWWGKFSDEKYADHWVDRYKSADEAGQAVLVSELSDWKDVAENTKKLKDSSDKFIEWEKNYQEGVYGDSWTKWMIRNKKKFSGKFQSTFGTWQITTFSLYDVYQVWTKFWEGRETIRKRRSDQEVAKLGQFFTFGQSAKEFRRMGEASEEQRTKEFEDNYGDLENYKIREYLYKTNDQDEARACINLLNKSGWLQWGDPALWRTLMRMGGGEYFDIPGDKVNLDQQQIEEKVRRCCRNIWSDKVFERWQTEKQGNLESSMKQYNDEFDRIEKTDKKPADILSQMLESWGSGNVDSDEINPVKFESFLKQAFEKGKINGNPDARWYFLIMAVTVRNPHTGHTLLDPDIFNRFQGLMDNFPYIEFFIDSRSEKVDGKIVPEGSDPRAKARPWTQHDFDCWAKRLTTASGKYSVKDSTVQENLSKFFYDTVLMSKDATTRMSRKINVGGSFDHDDAFSFAAGFSEESVAQKLTTKSEGGPQLTDDFWMNFLVGQNQHLFGKQKQIEEGDKKYGKENPEWQKTRESILLDVGRYMRATFVATQTLWGNGTIATGGARAQEFNDKYLEQGGSYGVQAANELKKCYNVALRKMFELNKDQYKLGKNDFALLDFDRKHPDKSGIDEEYQKGGDEGRKQRAKLLLSLSKESKSDMFRNTDAIEKAMNHYVNSVQQTEGGYEYHVK